MTKLIVAFRKITKAPKMLELAAFDLRRQKCRFIHNSISNLMAWFSSEGVRRCYITGRITSFLDFDRLLVFGTLISIPMSSHITDV